MRSDPDEVVIGAGLTLLVVRSVVRHHFSELRGCYESLLASAPAASGRVELRWTVTATGSVEGAAAGPSTLGSPETETCLVTAVAGWTFPAPDEGAVVQIVYPLLFEPIE